MIGGGGANPRDAFSLDAKKALQAWDSRLPSVWLSSSLLVFSLIVNTAGQVGPGKNAVLLSGLSFVFWLVGRLLAGLVRWVLLNACSWTSSALQRTVLARFRALFSALSFAIIVNVSRWQRWRFNCRKLPAYALERL